MRRLLDIDNILIYFLALNCLPENDIRRIEEAQRINADKAALELARLVKQRGSLDKFFESLKRSAHEDDHPGHKELLPILQKTVQGEKETPEENSFVLPGAVVPEPPKTVLATSHEGSIDTRGNIPQSSSADDERKEVSSTEHLAQHPALNLYNNCLHVHGGCNKRYATFEMLVPMVSHAPDCLSDFLHEMA